jgi:soluble lytic murein transglycosylase
MLAAGSPAAAADAKAYHQVLAAAHRDHFDEAERLAARTGPKALVKLVRWMEFSSRTSGSFAEVSAFIEANPDWPLQSQMQRHAEAAITAATPNAEVLAWFRKHPPVSVDGGMAFARALEATGRHDEAVETARRTWVEGGFGALQERQFLASFGDWIRPEDNWRRLDRLLWDKQEAPAQHMMLRVDVPHRQLAQARLALQGDRGNVESAIAAVPAALRDDPGLVYDRVRWRRQKDMDEEATELLNHPSRNKVRPDLWWQERGILARRALQKGLVSQAYQVASDNGLEPGTSQQADAEFLSGWIALRFLEDRETGAAHFQRLWDGATTSSTRARAAYWAGRAAEAGGEREQARAWYTKGARYVTAYYGQLSAARLDNHHWPLPPDPKPTAEDIKRFEGRDVVQAARLLIEAGEKDSLRAFFIRLNDIAETAGERALVGKLASHNGSTELAVVVARRADREGVTLLEAGWPTLPITVDNETEKALVLALIRQESNFHKAAVSSAGARGLMQLLPSTAAKVAKSIRVAYSPRKLDDPAFNVRVGSAYLDGLVSDFDGSYVLALASYNAGPGRARRWIREYGDPRDPKIDVVDWIESIPFTETRGYVQKVMESVEIYRRRLGHSGSGIEADLKRRGARRGTG